MGRFGVWVPVDPLEGIFYETFEAARGEKIQLDMLAKKSAR